MADKSERILPRLTEEQMAQTNTPEFRSKMHRLSEAALQVAEKKLKEQTQKSGSNA